MDDDLEERRLQALHELSILDTPREEEFDRIVRIAAAVCDAPMAAINLIDRDRSWKKAWYGAATQELRRSDSFCSQVILQDGPWIVEDALTDHRVSEHRVVRGGLGVRAYAGVPLRTTCGLNVGVLCVADRTSRRLDGSQVQRLVDLAGMVVEKLEFRLAVRRNSAALAEALDQKDLALAAIEDEIRRRVAMESTLRLEEDRLHDWAELSSDVRWEMDRDFRLTMREGGLDPRLGSGLGLTLWEFAKTDLTSPPYARLFDLLTRFEEFHDVQLPISTPDGDVVWIEMSGRPLVDQDGAFAGYRGSTSDITRRVKLEQELKMKAQQQQAVALLGQAALAEGPVEALLQMACDMLGRAFNVSHTGLFMPNAEGDRLMLVAGSGWEPSTVGTWGKAADRTTLAGSAFLAETPLLVVDAAVEHSDWRERQSVRGMQGLHSAMAVGIGELPRKFGVLAVYDTKPYIFNDDDKMLLQALAFVVGAALERREAVASLRLRDRALDAVGHGIAISGAGAGMPVVYVNAAMEDRLGLKSDALIGAPLLDGLRSPDRAELRAAVEQALTSTEGFSGQVTARRADGTQFTDELTISEVADETGKVSHYVSVHADITERLRLESELRQAQKIEAVGKLTGGVAHDFNNLLTVILGNAEILAESTDDPELRPLADMIVQAAERGADTVQRLLAFGRRQALEPEDLDVNTVVQNLLGLFRRSLGEEFTLQADLDPGALTANADRPQLETAILNLVVNARDSLGRGGTVTIATRAIELRDDTRIGPLKPGSYASITVSDTGCGMSPEVLERAFEPFFTTKDVGKGTGLGLSMVYGFVQQSGGWVRISSEVGTGTSVEILLPCRQIALSAPRSAEEARPDRGRERIMLVEDQADLCTFVLRQLTSLGYQVVPFANAQAAMDALRDGIEAELLFSDILLPGGMDGIELAEHAVAMRPGLKVLFTSGYSDKAVERSGRLLDGRSPLLKKPYRRAELAGAIRSALDVAS